MSPGVGNVRVVGAAALLFLAGAVAIVVASRSDAGPEPGPAAASVQLPAPGFPVVPAGGDVRPDDFVGAEACASCHRAQYDAWAGSTHGRAGGEPAPDLLIAPFDGAPIRFADGVVVPRARGGEYEFVVRQDGQDEAVYTVDGVVGGGHMLGGGTQGFLTRLADGTVRFLPWDWSRQEGVWFCNTGTRLDRGWVPIDEGMRMADCGDWPPVRVMGTEAAFANCQGCHGSQVRADPVEGEGHRTGWTTLAVNCESCHGPGRAHVEKAGATGFADGELAIDALGGLDKDASLGVCFRCHALKDVLKEGYLPGEPLETHFALKFPILGDDPYRPDGRIRTFAYQATHLYSACYLDGPMDCVSCHEPHGQGYQDVNRRPLRSPFDDGQCTACHASKAADPRAHTFHPPDSEGARCVACHMPYLQHPEVGGEIPFARSDHTIPVPRPAFDDSLGVESACALCHTDRSAAELQRIAHEWWGELKPHRPLVAALLRVDASASVDEAASELLRPDQHDPMAQFDALSRLLTRHLGPDDPDLPEDAVERLRSLAAPGRDMDVRALALATLHWTRGGDPATRSFLAGALENAESEEAIRRRWGLVLGFLADHYRERGDIARSRAAYDRALELMPDDPRLLTALGIMYNQAGEAANAAAAFRRSLAVEPAAPLAWVNLGIALNAMGDAAGAEAAYRRALEINPHEPLAWFNLGNAHLRRGEAERALEAYRASLRANPGLAQAHFWVGRILGEMGRYDEALPHARRAVEFQPDNASAREMLAALEQLTRR